MQKTIPFPRKPGEIVYWGNLPGDSLSLQIAKLIAEQKQFIFIVTPDSLSAQKLKEELQFFLPETLAPTIFPDWETLPYDMFSPHQDIISERISCLNYLLNRQIQLLIAPISTLMYFIASKDYIAKSSFQLQVGDHLDIHKTRQALQQQGYYATNQVIAHGEYAIRGAIMDIFPMGAETPYRIELFDNDVESIRVFDPETQLSLTKATTINLLPAKEFPLNEEAIRLFRDNWREQFSGNPMQSTIYQQISEGRVSSGIEYYLPLFFTQTTTLFDYLPQDALIVRINDAKPAAENFWHEVQERYQQNSIDHTKPLLKPEKLFLNPQQLFTALNTFLQLKITHQPTADNKSSQFNFHEYQQIPDVTVNHRLTDPLINLRHFLKDRQRILFCAESIGRRESLQELFTKYDIKTEYAENWLDFLKNDTSYQITISALEQGFIQNAEEYAIITEAQLFGEQVLQKRRRKEKRIDPNLAVQNLAELQIGSPVVHIDHGIGRFAGLQIIKTGDTTGEYLTLEYAGSDKLYVPVANLHLIGRYSGANPDSVPINKLGTNQWNKAKQRAQEKIRDVAAELLDIYARREAKKGFAFDAPNDEYYRFAESFPFEETPDQLKAIEDIIHDMTEAKPTDRLVCGDVGFGKTEVAMRAAFLATQSNKQVVMLVPTTLLAKQHFENFKDRFAEWPIRIECLSRFNNAKEQHRIVKNLEEGAIDIIIGTHKLLQSDIKFKNLGLLIIDEEHRFGVAQKEKLKALRSEVDILTLSATPIPRTLNMAMSGIRELSIIATPPEKRLSVKTFVHERSHQMIREALLREILRGGQVYFLHNKVDTIAKVTDELARLVPEAKIKFAHGQMRERELEHLMTDFYHQRFNVLVSTTIIESGIDIPTANTIVIDDADHFGVAQLHQLRGRVGRSHHQAYAYLMTPPKASLSKDAIKRLEAISAYDDLGVGFMLATHDLEIRGAGDLLGENQSGEIEAIGFSLYMEMLERAVESLKAGKEPSLSLNHSENVEIDLKISALIPDDYLPDVHQRLVLYKRLAGSKTLETLEDLKIEIMDRFGQLTPEIKSLISIHEIRIQAEKLGIRKIEGGNMGGKIEFGPQPKIETKTIIHLIQKIPQIYRLEGPNHLRYKLAGDDPSTRLANVKKVLNTLAVGVHTT